MNVEVPAATGVPVIAPLDASDRPPGSDPWITAKVYGCAPPVAWTVALYPAPTVPSDRLAVVIVGATGPPPVAQRRAVRSWRAGMLDETCVPAVPSPFSMPAVADAPRS